MRIVLQRVKKASVAVSGKTVSFIGKGFLLLVGIAKNDTLENLEKAANKTSAMRVFVDTDGKMNLNIKDAGGEVLSVPQFTLLANTEKGNRPGFDGAAAPRDAEKLWKHFNEMLRKNEIAVSEGVFGAHMEVSLVNDGPVTIVMDPK